jgi:hypothetical protein
MIERPDMKTSSPEYWRTKMRGAEMRVRLAARDLARQTTANGHARQTDEYQAAFRELMGAASAYQTMLYAIPREHRT